LLCHAQSVRRSNVAEINNAVEPALRQITQRYCSRVGGELSSNLPEFITRSTNPVS
jgi:hypothetical protein